MTDGEVIEAINDLLSVGRATNVEVLAKHLAADAGDLAAHLQRMEHAGQVLPVVLWFGDDPSSGTTTYWVRPGAAAEYMDDVAYNALEDRLGELARRRGYVLIGSPAGAPRRVRRYAIAVDSPGADGATIERVARDLRRLPPAQRE